MSTTVFGKMMMLLTGAIFALTVAFCALTLYWLYWPYHGLTVTEFSVAGPVVRGGAVRYTVRYCTDTPRPIREDSDRMLEEVGDNPATYPITPPLSFTIDSPCEQFVRVAEVPVFLPPGPYRIRVYTVLELNPLRSIRQTWLSTPFTVTR